MGAGYHQAETRCYEITATQQKDDVIVKAKCGIVALARGRILTLDVIYLFSASGEISIKIYANKPEHLPYLPRFGLRFFLPKNNQNVTYFGYGDGESYLDKHHATKLGLYHFKANENVGDNIKPQESGSHCGTHFVQVENLLITGNQPFSFNCSPYSQETLMATKHNYALPESQNTVLCVDYKMSGIGSYSCGPALKEQYRLNENRFEWSINIGFN